MGEVGLGLWALGCGLGRARRLLQEFISQCIVTDKLVTRALLLAVSMRSLATFSYDHNHGVPKESKLALPRDMGLRQYWAPLLISRTCKGPGLLTSAHGFCLPGGPQVAQWVAGSRGPWGLGAGVQVASSPWRHGVCDGLSLTGRVLRAAAWSLPRSVGSQGQPGDKGAGYYGLSFSWCWEAVPLRQDARQVRHPAPVLQRDSAGRCLGPESVLGPLGGKDPPAARFWAGSSGPAQVTSALIWTPGTHVCNVY